MDETTQLTIEERVAELEALVAALGQFVMTIMRATDEIEDSMPTDEL